MAQIVWPERADARLADCCFPGRTNLMDRLSGPGDDVGTAAILTLPLRKEWQELLADRDISFCKSATLVGAGHADYAMSQIHVVPSQGKKLAWPDPGTCVDAEQDDPLNMGRRYTKQSRQLRGCRRRIPSPFFLWNIPLFQLSGEKTFLYAPADDGSKQRNPSVNCGLRLTVSLLFGTKRRNIRSVNGRGHLAGKEVEQGFGMVHILFDGKSALGAAKEMQVKQFPHGDGLPLPLWRPEKKFFAGNGFLNLGECQGCLFRVAFMSEGCSM
nr:hypothetical protein [uncultured Bilophila sp.]